ncbi:MAG: cold shock domain-containing protein, partial [Candidatus Kaelpia imicola]|nr:cold shock domain-containing protein [Candidatus Kaelpia imicola]
FHKNSLVGVEFDVLNEDTEVEFEIEKTPKGASAVNVSIAKK